MTPQSFKTIFSHPIRSAKDARTGGRGWAICLSLLLALLAIPMMAPPVAATERTFNAILTRSGDGVAFARASGGARCAVDASVYWSTVGDDGQSRTYVIPVRYGDYDYISASLFSDLEAPGWFDEAYRSVEVFQDSTRRGSWTHSEDFGDWEFTWDTQKWRIGNGEEWRFLVTVWGLDYGGQTCWASGDFRVQSVESTSSLDYYEVSGYQGNMAIYMSTWISSLEPVILETMTSHSEAVTDTNCGRAGDSVHNGVVLAVGKATTTPSQDLVFREFYDGGGRILTIYVPMALAGGSDVYHCTGAADYRANRFTLTFAVRDSPSSTVHILTEYNSGSNVTGPENKGTTKSEALGRLAWEAMSHLAGMGFLTGTTGALQELTGNVDRKLSFTGPGEAWQTFRECVAPPYCDVSHIDQFTYNVSMYLQVVIPLSQFMSSSPRFFVTAENRVDYFQGLKEPKGATATIAIQAYPAFMLTGTVTLLGDVARNHDVIISTTDSGPFNSINYHLKTNSEGKYRFLAKPNTPYTISSSNPTSFGTATAQVALTTPNSPEGWVRDLTLPASKIEGYVKDSGGPGINGATVVVTSPSGATFTTSSNSNGYYSLTTNSLGTHTVRASAGCGYSSQTQTVSVGAFSTVYGLDFTLSRYSGTGNIAPIYVTGNGGPVSGASVIVRDCYGTQVYSAWTDGNGMVPGISGLPAGLYTVHAHWSTGAMPCPEYGWNYRGSVTLTVPPSQSPTVHTGPYQQHPYCYF